MVFVDTGRDQVAFVIGGSLSNSGTGWFCAIGSGSGAVTTATTGLVAETDRNQITGSPDLSAAKRVTTFYDFSASEMSGTVLTELGVFKFAAGDNAWNVEGFAGVNFDGSNELQVEVEFRVF